MTTKIRNTGWFPKGKSGNPDGGRRRKPVPPKPSAVEVLLDKVVTIDGREVPVEASLQHRVYRDALAGKRRSIRQVLQWIEQREAWRGRRKPSLRPPIIRVTKGGDPSNIDEALVLLGIATHNPERAEFEHRRAQLLLEFWAVKAALSRRNSVRALSEDCVREIYRCTRGLNHSRPPGHK